MCSNPHDVESTHTHTEIVTIYFQFVQWNTNQIAVILSVIFKERTKGTILEAWAILREQ